ncbi:helix-turn-helix transcriptional regulator [Streptomyces sp. FH025]|uniref:helix-turn-helix domain-containing protein n=1 Tax=Streptomyces sp. FH025 TaxID=2815937 RepID=UPI001A9D2ED0|nr:helix-turn-helix transcriptional regulator [Streptomyces sp. FH025]MBO1413904.1 helix-turn-helix domain-containing protein [Streptomyces sp. FH025]
MSGERHHNDLGKALRALRIASDKTAETIARRASMSPAKLSKIENAKTLPSVQDVDLILTALGISGEAKAEFLEAARSAATEEMAWRELRRMGHWKHQQAIKAIESQTTVLRLFQGQLVPGLLQSAEYVAAVFALDAELSKESKAKTIAARLERQTVLYDRHREFHFIICEHVLRWRVCPPSVMATQLDRIVSLSRLPNVTIGVLPLSRRMPEFPMTCFSMYDDRLVIVETFHSEITTRDPRDVDLYLSTFSGFDAVALHGDDMRAMVEGIRDEFFREQESA